MEKDVGYLLIAKPVAFNQLGIRHDCTVSFNLRLGQLFVVLFEDHHFCCHRWQKTVCLKFVRSGNKVLQLLVFGLLVCKSLCGTPFNVHDWIVNHLMNSGTRKQPFLLSLSCVVFLGMQGRKVVTWLILPVVICLSQRLSHACLSINKFVLWNCEWLIKSVIVYLMVTCYMDNCGNSRANTCNQAPTSGRGVFIR